MKVEKAGLVLNANKEIVQWVNVGEDFDLKDGDMIISHHKTAEKYGVAEEFKSMKPAKTAKEKGARVRVTVPTTGNYTVVSNRMKIADDSRGEIAKAVVSNSNFEDLFAAIGEKFTTVGRNGETKEHSVKQFVGYCIRRGMIQVAA